LGGRCIWKSPSVEKIEAAVEAVNSEADYVDLDDACEGLVACEVVARLKGNWGERSTYSEAIDSWVESSNENPSTELVQKASVAISRILGEDSELKELWDEDGNNEDWRKEMERLRERVEG